MTDASIPPLPSAQTEALAARTDVRASDALSFESTRDTARLAQIAADEARSARRSAFHDWNGFFRAALVGTAGALPDVKHAQTAVDTAEAIADAAVLKLNARFAAVKALDEVPTNATASDGAPPPTPPTVATAP